MNKSQRIGHFCSNPEHEIRFAESTENGQVYCSVCKAPFRIEQRQ